MFLACPNCSAGGTSLVRDGHFYRASESRKIQCLECKSRAVNSYPEPRPQIVNQHKDCPRAIKTYFPKSKYPTHKSNRSRSNGQGGDEKTGRDPLFSVNKTSGMFCDKLSRLTRQFWNLRKKMPCLDDHLAIYMQFHNRSIWESMEKIRLKKLAE